MKNTSNLTVQSSLRKYSTNQSRKECADSAPNPLRPITQPLKLLNNPIPMVALDFDAPVLDRAARAEPILQLGGKLGEAVLVQWQVGDDGHSFSTPAFRLSTNPNHGGLARDRWLALAGASGLKLVALGAEEVSPTTFHSFTLSGDQRATRSCLAAFWTSSASQGKVPIGSPTT